MYPTWWRKIRHSFMSETQVLAYGCLRIRRAVDAIENAGSVMRRRDLAFHIREIGNALVEMCYADRDCVLKALRDPALCASICAARHLLAHDEVSVPDSRLTSFLPALPVLRSMLSRLMSMGRVSSQIAYAESFLLDDADREIPLTDDSAEPFSSSDDDYIAVCLAIMRKDIADAAGNRVVCAIDFIARFQTIMALDESLATTCTAIPYKPMKKARALLLEGSGDGGFMQNNAVHVERIVCKALRHRPEIMEMSALCAAWIEKNTAVFAKLRKKACRRWRLSAGDITPAEQDSGLSRIMEEVAASGDPAGSSPACR